MPRELVLDVLRKVNREGTITVTEMGDNLWQVDAEGCTLILTYKPEVDVLELLLPFSTVPEGAGQEFYRFLLELNFDSVLYGAFALKESEVVLVDRLNCADLHKQEVIGSIKALREAMLRVIPSLKEHRRTNP